MNLFESCFYRGQASQFKTGMSQMNLGPGARETNRLKMGYGPYRTDPSKPWARPNKLELWSRPKRLGPWARPNRSKPNAGTDGTNPSKKPARLNRLCQPWVGADRFKADAGVYQPNYVDSS